MLALCISLSINKRPALVRWSSGSVAGTVDAKVRLFSEQTKLLARNLLKFDLWHLQNAYIKVNGIDVKLSDFMDIERREAKNCIPKKNQEYVLRVAFNVLGSYTNSE